MFEFPFISIGIAVFHIPVTCVSIGHYPYDNKFRSYGLEPFLQVGYIFLVPYFGCKRRVQNNSVVILNRLESDGQNRFVLKVSYLPFKERGTAIIRLFSHFKYSFRQRDKAVFIEIYRPVQLRCNPP